MCQRHFGRAPESQTEGRTLTQALTRGLKPSSIFFCKNFPFSPIQNVPPAFRHKMPQLGSTLALDFVNPQRPVTSQAKTIAGQVLKLVNFVQLSFQTFVRIFPLTERGTESATNLQVFLDVIARELTSLRTRLVIVPYQTRKF